MTVSLNANWPGMQIDAEHLQSGILKITLIGRLDVQGADEIDLRFAGLAARQKAVIVDMREVSFLASIGIRTLLLSAKAIAKRGGKMALLDPDPTVTRSLEMAGIDALIPICRSLEQAQATVTT